MAGGAAAAAVLPEQVRQPVRRDAGPVVSHRDRDVGPLGRRRDADGGRLGRMQRRPVRVLRARQQLPVVHFRSLHSAGKGTLRLWANIDVPLVVA